MKKRKTISKKKSLNDKYDYIQFTILFSNDIKDEMKSIAKSKNILFKHSICIACEDYLKKYKNFNNREFKPDFKIENITLTRNTIRIDRKLREKMKELSKKQNLKLKEIFYFASKKYIEKNK